MAPLLSACPAIHRREAGCALARSAATWGCNWQGDLRLSHMQGYLGHGDATAAEKALRELAVPFFHHEFVRQAVMQALHGADSEALIIDLLGQLSECGLVSSNQLAKVSGSAGDRRLTKGKSVLQCHRVFRTCSPCKAPLERPWCMATQSSLPRSKPGP